MAEGNGNLAKLRPGLAIKGSLSPDLVKVGPLASHPFRGEGTYCTKMIWDARANGRTCDRPRAEHP